MNYKQLLIGKAYVGIDHLRQKGPNVTNLWEKTFQVAQITHEIFLTIKYGFCKKSLRKDATLTS